MAARLPLFIIILLFTSPRPLLYINKIFIQGRVRGDVNTRMIITVASDCAGLSASAQSPPIILQGSHRESPKAVSKLSAEGRKILKLGTNKLELELRLYRKYFFDATLSTEKSTSEINRSRPKLNYGVGRDFGVGPEFVATRKQPIIPGNSRTRSFAGEEDRGNAVLAQNEM